MMGRMFARLADDRAGRGLGGRWTARIALGGAASLRAVVLGLVVVALAFTGCGGGGSTKGTRTEPGTAAGAPGAAVTFSSTGDVTLSGRLFGTGPDGVVLAHMYPADQTSWFPYAERLAAAGYRVLTFDFRGYGTSTGGKDIAKIDQDVEAAVRKVKAEGAQRVALVGASMGGTASLIAAGRVPVVGVATLSAPVEFMGLDARSAVPQVSAPKLFLAAEKDVGAAGARELDRLAAPPKTLVLYPGSDHGTALLTGSNGIAVADRITSFLQSAFSRP